MVAIFPNVCLWRRSYSQNWEVLTLKNCHSIEPPSYASTAYIIASYAWPSFPFYCFVKIWATCENFLDKWFTASPGKKLPVRLWPRARKKCRGKQETKSSVSPYFSSVLISRFLSTLQKNRAQSRLLLYLFYDKESVKFPTRSYFKTNFFFKANVSVVIVFYTDSHKTRLK